MTKTWVIIKYNTGKISVWRDYGDVAWGSSIYEVLGYYNGTYREAIAASLPSEQRYTTICK